MATLTDSLLSFEFVFKNVDDCLWIKYEFYFRWNGESVFRDELLKRNPSGWSGRSPGALCANEYDRDTLLPVLQKVLTSTSPTYWQPTEPDVIIGFYPDQEFPFIPRTSAIWYTDRIKQQMEARRIQKAAHNGVLPDDTITMIVFVDAYNWKNCAPYRGSGLGMIMRPKRSELAKFHRELQSEYRAFVVKERLAERLEEQSRRITAEEKTLAAEDESEEESDTEIILPPPTDPTRKPAPPVSHHPTDDHSAVAHERSLDDWATEGQTWIPLDQLTDPQARVLAQAALDSHSVNIQYWGGSTPGRIRKIQPKGVFTVPGRDETYIAALDLDRAEERCYRLDRLTITTQ